MTNFNINTFTTTAQVLGGSEAGFVGVTGTIAESNATVVTVTNTVSQTSNLTVLGTILTNCLWAATALIIFWWNRRRHNVRSRRQ